jgi:MoaA/NifB/PqqE/SkfB family radical SAM enzyme
MLHDFITQSPGSFDQAIQGIKNLRSINHHENIQSSTVIIRQNYISLSDIINLLEPFGIKIFHFIYVIPYDSVMMNNQGVLIKLSEITTHLQEMLEVVRKKQLQAAVENVPFCMLQGYESHLTRNVLLSTLKFNQRFIIDKNEVSAKDWIKTQVCAGCKYYSNCKGLHRNYLKEFGDKEVMPVKELQN